MLPFFPLDTQPPLPSPSPSPDTRAYTEEGDTSAPLTPSPPPPSSLHIICVLDFPVLLLPATLARVLARGLRSGPRTFLGFNVIAAPLGTLSSASTGMGRTRTSRGGSQSGSPSLLSLKFYASAVEISSAAMVGGKRVRIYIHTQRNIYIFTHTILPPVGLFCVLCIRTTLVDI